MVDQAGSLYLEKKNKFEFLVHYQGVTGHSLNRHQAVVDSLWDHHKKLALKIEVKKVFHALLF